MNNTAIPFLIYDLETGIIETSGIRPYDSIHLITPPAGFGILYEEADILTDLVNTTTHTVEKNTRPTPPDIITYSEARKLTYPPIGDQLDMLWHAMNDNILPRVEPFYTLLKTVKEKFPPGISVERNSVITYTS